MPETLNTRSMIGFYGTLEMIIYRWCMKHITTWSNYGMKKGEEFWVKAWENVGNIYLIDIAFLNLSLSACIRTWSPSRVPFGQVNFLYIALIKSKLVALYFVVIYYVGLNTNIPHYTRMCITMLCSHQAATISTPAWILA